MRVHFTTLFTLSQRMWRILLFVCVCVGGGGGGAEGVKLSCVKIASNKVENRREEGGKRPAGVFGATALD